MIRSAWLRAGTVALIPFATEVWQIAVLAVIVSIGTALSLPAELSALPLTVPADQLVSALSLTQVTSSIMRIVGPAVGATLIGSIGTGAAFGTEACCFVAAIACLRPLRIPESTDSKKAVGPMLASAKSEIMEGLRCGLANADCARRNLHGVPVGIDWSGDFHRRPCLCATESRPR